MIKNIVMLCLFLIILFPSVYVNASPGNAELVLENIQIEPPYPKKGELTRITGEIYNAGIIETKSLASIITAAYFVDEKLLFIGEIGNVKPGIENKIKISSDPIWNAETGNHVIKIILDYHDTLNDQQDSFDNNIVEKTFSISPHTNYEIPNWIRNNAGWWASGTIDDASFINAIQFLIKENILQIPYTQSNSFSPSEIPNWIRNNAGWWASGKIDDASFINAIQFLIKERISIIS